MSRNKPISRKARIASNQLAIRPDFNRGNQLRRDTDDFNNISVTIKDVDAAIIFSDILMLPYGLGQKVVFEKNFGPRLGELNLEKVTQLTQKDILKKINQVNEAIKVNSLFPIQLSKIIKLKKNKIYQIATDCVYSGEKGNYVEMSKHDALDVYGKTKSLGEVNKKNFFNIRVSIIGKEINTKNSLVEWFLSNKKKEKIFGFTNHLWNGVTTSVFAEVLFTIIDKKINILTYSLTEFNEFF